MQRSLATILEASAGHWDADDSMWTEALASSIPGRFVTALEADDPNAMRTLAFLGLACAVRCLPCWDLYCDTEGPRLAIAAAERILADSSSAAYDSALETAAVPTFQGMVIGDCRASDTLCAAESAAAALRFASRRDRCDAIDCISAAQMAFDQSPLCRRDAFVRWLVTIAVPAAIAGRPLDDAERVTSNGGSHSSTCPRRAARRS